MRKADEYPMTNKEFENKINDSFESITPNIIESIKKDCKGSKEGIIMSKENKVKLFTKKWASLVAVFVLILSVVFANGVYYNANAKEATVTLDVNPSIEISLKKDNRVLDIKPLNEDGRQILSNMDLKNVNLDVAVNALLGSMLKNGYLSDMANSILVSVDGQNTEKSTQIQNEISSQIELYMQNNNLNSAVVSQNVVDNQEAILFAEKYDISVGKAQYILEVVKAHPNYNAADLADLSINEINVLVQNSNGEVPNVNSNGTASEKSYIGKESAIEIALKNAGLSKSSVKDLEAEFDIEKKNNEIVMVYEVEFDANNMEYSFDIDAVTGEIIKSKSTSLSQEEIEENKNDLNGSDDDEKDDLDKIEDDNDIDDDDDKDDVIVPQDNYISSDKAKSIALNHAGFSANEVSDLEAKLDSSHSKIYYEVEFDKDNYEYEYKLDPVSGSIIKNKATIDS